MNRVFAIPLVESCCISVEEAVESERRGANRIELCQDLECGGLTPEVRTISSCVTHLHAPVYVLVRPRAGDFFYSDQEFEGMKRSIETARNSGAEGVVLGVLTAAGDVDVPRTSELVDHAEGLQVTFHKAFDAARNLPDAFNACREAGIHRILCSGGAATAREGKQVLSRLAKQPGPIIMAGGGVRADHVRWLVQQTGVPEIHARAEAIAGIQEAIGAG